MATESATIEAPAPAAAPAPAEALSTATPEINVSSLKPATQPAPVKKGSARERMIGELHKRFPTPEDAEAAKPVSPKGDKTPEAPVKEGGEAPAEPAAPTDEKKGKVSPWKLVDEYKQKLAKAEAEILEAGKRGIPKEEWDKQTAESERVRKRAEELEQQIQFVDYSKSKEFQDKFQAPYEAEWKRAMRDLGSVQIRGEDGDRALNAKDILQLVNMDVQSAQEMAEEKFGRLAERVMNHRDKIRELFDKQQEALEDAQKNGQTRIKAQQEEHSKIQKAVTDSFTKFNETSKADEAVGRFLKPVEGDQEWNDKLSKAESFVDKAFSENALAPGLTMEQRQQIAERHAATRNRAIAYTLLRHENAKLTARAKALEEELGQYKQAEPKAGGSAPQPAGETKGWDRIRQGLQKVATK